MSSLFPCYGRLQRSTYCLDVSQILSRVRSRSIIQQIDCKITTQKPIHVPQSLFRQQQNIMQNQQLKQKIQEVWISIKGSKAGDLELLLQESKLKAAEILGSNQIDKIRHSSLLKLLLYELIIFADQKMTNSKVGTKIIEQGASKTLLRLNQLKEVVFQVSSSGNSTQGGVIVEISALRALLQRLKMLEKEMIREQQARKRVQQQCSSDSEGNSAMIEQLEEIINRKENRIKELTLELQQNFRDKQELEDDIEQLQLINCDLNENIKNLQDSQQRQKQNLQDHKTKIQSLQKTINNLTNQISALKQKQKEELLFGINSFMAHPIPAQKRQLTPQSIANIQPKQVQYSQPITNSTKLLTKYCLPQVVIEPQSKDQQRTVRKKKMIKMVQSQSEGEGDLLLLSKKSSKPQKSTIIQNEDHTVQRMLLMQALIIESTLKQMLA